MPAFAAAAEQPVLPNSGRYTDLKDLLDEKREEDRVGPMTVQDLDSFFESSEPDPARYELYSIFQLRPFADAIAWRQEAMEIVLNHTHGDLERDSAEDEFIKASSAALLAYSEAVSEAIRNTRGVQGSLEKAAKAVIEYRRFTRCTARILSRLVPELTYEALLQIP
jgi:hypothetical protein